MNNFRKNGFFNPLAIIVFFIGIIISIVLFSLISNATKKITHSEFEYLLKRQTASIQREINLNMYVLHALKSYHNDSTKDDRIKFKTFALNLLETQKSIQALEWIPRITNENRSKFELERKNELGSNFVIKEKSSEGKMINARIKDEYFPIDFIEPFIENEAVLGFDLSSNETRFSTLNEAKSKNKMTASPKIKLVQEEAKQFGFVVATPIWKDIDNKILEGFYIGVFRIGDIINTALNFNKLDNSMLDIWLVDTTQSHNNELLYTNTKEDLNYIDSIDINVLGRKWTLYAKPSPKFIETNSSYIPIFVLFLCLFVTLLIAYIISIKGIESGKLGKTLQEKRKDLLESNKKLESLLFMFDQRVIASRTNKRGIITYATNAFCKISGYSKEELIGKDHRIVKHPEMLQGVYDTLWETISTGNIFTGEIKNMKKDGDFYWVNVTIFPEFDDNRNIIGYFAIREDITAKKEVENFNETLSLKIKEAVAENRKKDKLLLQQSKLAAMGEMIGAIAHQWRQPLNTLAIKLQFIEDDYEDGLLDKVYLEKYSKECMTLVTFMSKTIDDFRNFFNIDKTKTYFDVKSKIIDTTNILSAQLENYNIKLEILGDSFTVFGHASEFQQVILNIVNNAKDILVEKNVKNANIIINLSTDENNNGYIKISDNAEGIPENILERIFEPYFTTKEQGKGTGLGLYMSKIIIEENMQGKLEAFNSAEGAIFIIKIGVPNE
jgi:PAS domain S-box-containing protein